MQRHGARRRSSKTGSRASHASQARGPTPFLLVVEAQSLSVECMAGKLARSLSVGPRVLVLRSTTQANLEPKDKQVSGVTCECVVNSIN